jgi:AcrR family transcriptional regulator
MRAQILTVAEELMRTDGLAHATTRSIAAHAGCSEGTIYRHFKSKEDIFLAVLSERMPDFLPMMRGISENVGRGSVGSRLGSVMRSALSFYKATIPITVSIFAEPQLLNQYRKWMNSNNVGPHRAVELLADYISREQAAGRVNPLVNALSAAETLLGACYLRAYSRQFAAVAPTSDNKFIADTIALLLRGMNPSSEEFDQDAVRAI